jgi:hypothetical protein
MLEKIFKMRVLHLLMFGTLVCSIACNEKGDQVQSIVERNVRFYMRQYLDSSNLNQRLVFSKMKAIDYNKILGRELSGLKKDSLESNRPDIYTAAYMKNQREFFEKDIQAKSKPLKYVIYARYWETYQVDSLKPERDSVRNNAPFALDSAYHVTTRLNLWDSTLLK